MTAEHLGAASEAGIEAAGRLGLGPMAVVERAFLAMAEQRVDTARELAQAALEQAGANDYLAARCLTVLSAAAGIEGDFPQMAALAERADAKAPPEQWHGTIASAVTSHLRAYRALLLGSARRVASSWRSPRWRSPDRRATTSPRCCSTRRSRRSAERP